MHDRVRFSITLGGVALAVILILVMAGIFAGSEEHAVAYIKNQPADLWLMQAGVENLHMSSSLLPPEVVQRIRRDKGVSQAVGLLNDNAAVDLGEALVYSYIFAVPEGAPFGGPWEMAQGKSAPEEDELILDEALADRYRLAIGDETSLYGAESCVLPA